MSKWSSFDNLLFQSGASVISKKGQRQLFQGRLKFISKLDSYFKTEQKLFQSGAVTSKWANVISKCSSYLKVGQLFQSRT